MVVLKNKATGLCWDASLSGSGGWDRSILYPCDANNSNQQLRWDGSCLKVGNRHHRYDGEQVGFTTRGSCDNADWKDDYTIRFHQKGTSYCVDAAGKSSKSKISLWGCNDGDFQKWIPLDWVDCNHPPNSFHPNCNRDKRHFPSLEQTRKVHCNSNKATAFSNECAEWCNATGQCTLKDRFVKCATYNIGDNECTDAKITEIQNKCIQLGFIDQTTKTPIGTAQCNQSSINTFLNECKSFIPKYISSESGCTSAGLADAKIRKLTDENAEKARLQAEKIAEEGRKRQEEDTKKLIEAQKEDAKKREEELQKVSQEQIEARKAAQLQMEQTLLSVVDPESLPENLKDKVPSKNNTTYILLVIIILLLVSMSFFLITF
jgi:hypothetical protein